MSESDGVIRVNISVPKALKARMESASEKPNWSAVACQAFEQELLRIESERKGLANMDDVIARLKAADELDSKETYQDGYKAGEEWAKTDARPKALRRLDKAHHESQYGLEYDIDVMDNGHNRGSAEGLWSIFHPNPDNFRVPDVNEFWDGVVGDGGRDLMDDPDFAKGWVRGALDLWEKVEDKV